MLSINDTAIGEQAVAEKTGPTRRKRQQTKDRVLQARIPEQLDEELRDRAEQLGLSVSTIVRNVLLHTFDLVEGVVIDSSQIARALAGRSVAAPDPDTEPAVIGWQEVTLNQNGVCEQCNVILPLGQRAAIGVPTGPRAALLCMDCLAALPAAVEDKPAPAEKKKATKRPARKKSTASKKTAD
jgi:hypothetical protein